MSAQKRWILLEHKGAPDDPLGIHFDLLVEDEQACRTWRLSKIPVLDGPAQQVILLPAHRLEWLDRLSGEVSGGRGWTRRVMGGFFLNDLPKNHSDPLQIEIYSQCIVGKLTIKNCLCKLCSVHGSTFIP